MSAPSFVGRTPRPRQNVQEPFGTASDRAGGSSGRRPQTSSTRRFFVGVVAIMCTCLYSLVSLYKWNETFVQQEREAPLDHWATTLKKPWYALTCPRFSNNGNLLQNTTSSRRNATSEITDVPFFMISARPSNQVQPIMNSWKEQNVPVQLVNTHLWSVNYKNTKCQRKSFGSRLFFVYQQLLSQYFLHPTGNTTTPSSVGSEVSHVVVLEDDAMLVDGISLRQELEWAISRDLDYYSFFSIDPTSCVYNRGTVAQVISRRLAERIVHSVDLKSFCRLPIDIWIAKQGPWYVTRRKLVEHVGQRLHLPL